MYNILMSKVYKDIKNIININELDNFFYLHFNLSLYIRNKYLYNHSLNRRILAKHYKTNEIDELSFLVLKDIIKKLQKKKLIKNLVILK